MAETQSFQLTQPRPNLTLFDLVTHHQSFSSAFFRLAFRLKIWVLYSVCSCKSAAAVSGLLLGHEVVDVVVVRVLITYLTDTWETNNILIKSLTVVSSQKGLAATLVIIMTFVSDTKIGRFRPIIFLGAFFISGLLILTICSYVPQVAFGAGHIIAVFCLSAGRAIVQPAKKFMSDQLRSHEPKNNIDENRVQARTKVWYLAAQLLTAGLTFVIFDNLGSWPLTFTSSTSLMVTTYLCFLYGARFYHCKDLPTNADNHLTYVFAVIKAAVLKKRYSANQMIVPKNRDQLYKDVEHLLRMFPLWASFLGFGLGLATADTLFSEQGNNMKLDISVVLLLLLKNFSGIIVSNIFEFAVRKCVPDRGSTTRKRYLLVRIWVGMFLSIICFIVAWEVEVRRLKVIRDHGLLDKPKTTIPMSTWWLSPQFCIFGAMERLAVDGLDEFYSEQVPTKSLENYGSAFKEFFVGTGNFISVICVHASGTWIRQTLNLSRLDKYYIMISTICFVNLCIYSYVLTRYWKNFEGQEDQEIETSAPDVLSVPPLNINVEAIV